ncbi:MAG: DNA-processing protein DprA [Bacteriovoracia bacterium]
MEILRFIHQFFHLTVADYQKRWPQGEPKWEDLHALFAEPVLPRRSLSVGDVPNLTAARYLYESILREQEELGIRTLAYPENGFPSALAAHIAPERRPALLYLRGHDIPREENCVGVVGTRRPSPLGADAASNFATYFSGMQLHVISGLARGIDSIAHRENLDIGTVAVLGSGVGTVYPRENQALAEDILAEGGSLLSPFPLYQVPLPQNFPARNEVIAALACGTVVVEGAEQSGAAITGKQALAMGKTVVVLGQDFRTSFGRGAIRLQQAGAVMAASEEEALQAIFAPLGGFSRQEELKGRSSRKIFGIEEFRMASGKSYGEAVVLLEEAILRGRIERVGLRQYRFTRKPSIDA